MPIIRGRPIRVEREALEVDSNGLGSDLTYFFQFGYMLGRLQMHQGDLIGCPCPIFLAIFLYFGGVRGPGAHIKLIFWMPGAQHDFFE